MERLPAGLMVASRSIVGARSNVPLRRNLSASVAKAQLAARLFRREGWVVLITALFLVNGGSRVHAEEIKIANTGPGINILPLEVAGRKGFFREEGLDVLNITMRANIAINALLTRGVDYATPSTSIVKAAATGLPVKL